MDKTNFKATFTLSQEGLEGDIVSELTFEPLVDQSNVDEAPAAYEMMAFLVQQYLYAAGVIDEEGDLIDPEAFHNQTKLTVLGDRSKLN